jgi:hypothetical protein
MGDKQALLADALPRLLDRLAHPRCASILDGSIVEASGEEPSCPEGTSREHIPVRDVHVAVVSSSLGGHGSDACVGQDKKAHPGDGHLAPGEDGCSYPSSLEAWYRFLIDPDPPASVVPGEAPEFPAVIAGTDEVLVAQRAEFLRPDSLVLVVNVSDKNDASVMDGPMPPDVCEDPTLDELGRPAGCGRPRVGWPPGYTEGNFEEWEVSQRRTLGTPFPANHITLLQSYQGQPFHLNSGTKVCEADPYDPGCRSCYTGAEGCKPLGEEGDPVSLRAWDQKRRFGVDTLYPLRRYVDGLTQTKVYDRNGFLVQNPLFDDLPYTRAQAQGKTLGRIRAEPRNSLLVFYASVVGVPWQDIAIDPKDLSRGYEPAYATKEGEAGIDWDLILGNPFALEKIFRNGPKDPLMIESTTPRVGLHPITGEPIGTNVGNSLNGRERETGGKELQFTCLFDLPEPRDCAGQPSSPSCPCGPAGGSQMDPRCGVGPGESGPVTIQHRAGASPGTRFLQVAKDFGQNAVVASICPGNMHDPSREDHALLPAMEAIYARLRSQFSPILLASVCLKSPVPVGPSGVADLLVVEGFFPGGSTSAEVEACRRCDAPGRRPLAPEVEALLRAMGNQGMQSGVSGGETFPSAYGCLCELRPLEGAAIQSCQTAAPDQELPQSGWCILGEAQMVSLGSLARCPAGTQQVLRFSRAIHASLPAHGSLFLFRKP